MAINKLTLNEGDQITLEEVKQALNQPEAIEKVLKKLLELNPETLKKTTSEQYVLERIMREVCGERSTASKRNHTLDIVRAVAGVPDNQKVLHAFLKLKERVAEARAPKTQESEPVVRIVTSPDATATPPAEPKLLDISNLAPDEEEDAGLFSAPKKTGHENHPASVEAEMPKDYNLGKGQAHPASMVEGMEETPAEPKPAEETSAEPKPVNETPAESKPAEEKPAEEKPAEEKPAEPTKTQASVTPEDLIAGFAADSPEDKSEIKAAAQAVLTAGEGEKQPQQSAEQPKPAETPASAPGAQTPPPPQPNLPPKELPPKPAAPIPASAPAPAATPTPASAPAPKPITTTTRTAPTKAPAYVPTGKMVGILRDLGTYLNNKQAKLPKEQGTDKPIYKDAKTGKPLLRGSFGGLLSDKAHKEAIARNAVELLRGNDSNITKLCRVREFIRANNAATGPQFHSGELAKLLVRAEDDIKANMTPRERGIAELKDYLAVAKAKGQRENFKLPLRTNQNTKLDKAIEVLEKLEANPQMPEKEFNELLDEAIVVNKKATTTLIGKGKLHDIYQNLRDDTTPEARKKPKHT
jgi:hypothetical protein